MMQVKKMLLSTTIAAIAASFGASAFAQTAASPPAAGDTGQPSAQVAPAPQNLVAPSSTDPFVQKRNATSQANAEYRASKKASKADLKASDKAAKAQYKEQVRNAKINQKADKQAANNELKEDAPTGTGDPGVQH